jgi:DNA-binding protein WhiA
MSGPHRALAEALRAELAAVDPTRPCCRGAERAGLGDAASGRARSPVVARVAVRFATTPAAPFDWSRAASHCRFAYLRGLFLARGSLSIGSGRTHLEFVVEPPDVPRLLEWLREVDLPASSRRRRGRGVVTWKSTERVIQFLRAAGAGPALLDLEARGVGRTFGGEMNRLANADAANVRRSVRAAVRQVAAISGLEATGRLAAERDQVREIALARRRDPEATLDELAGELALSRSAVQRALARIERLAAVELSMDPAETVVRPA